MASKIVSQMNKETNNCRFKQIGSQEVSGLNIYFPPPMKLNNPSVLEDIEKGFKYHVMKNQKAAKFNNS